MTAENNSNFKQTHQSTTVTRLSDESTMTNTCATQSDQNINRECVTFVWLDLRRDSIGNFLGTLRGINDCVRTFTDVSTCLDYIKTSQEKIFFVSSSSNVELLNTVNVCIAVEAIFVLDPDTNSIRAEFSKLTNIFTQQEELIRVLKATLNTFEQIQLEKFSFETDKMFLWWQLWREEIASKTFKVNDKNELVEQARHDYRGNTKWLKLVDEFDKSYRTHDAVRWCFRVSFPARPLRYALMSPTVKLLSSYQCLIVDVIRILQQQSKRAGHGQVYRGMKLSSELIDSFETHIDQLVCMNGFFMCTKSRNIELQLAASPGYRSDLSSVLFKIDFDASAPIAEVKMEHGSTIVVFDIATSFRVVCVNRGLMSIIKMKIASDEGKKLAADHKEKHKGKTIKILLDELSIQRKPPTPPLVSSIQSTSPASNIDVRNVPTKVGNSEISEHEVEARKCLKHGDVDGAIRAYRRIRPMSIRIIKLIGRLFADEKHEYDNALECYEQAFKIQEEVKRIETDQQGEEDMGDTLSRLGLIHYHRSEYDLALKYHMRALPLYESAQIYDSSLIATCLTNISNVYQAQSELHKALDYAQRAWTLCESYEYENDMIVAKSLVLLANIHHHLGDDGQALKVGTRALTLLEHTRPSSLSQTAELLNTLGLIQMNLGDLSEARHYFERSLKIYSHIAPTEQENVAKTEKNLQCVLEIQHNIENLHHYS
ncbi:unnamed protein product [Rotaria magnacalcarata]|uniref:Uncharacterized protein n=1 Tax=Rotaria magnacalcarata TaxID=392030 RepID=A0A815BSR2_9BILA|nr:unnamed protein product [Rotaria magnacalcarata]